MPTAVPVGSMYLTLDIVERQLLEFFDDPAFPAHHRILLLPMGGSRWIVATPTLDIYMVDLAECDIAPLARLAQFPVGTRPIFAFDVLTAAQLDQLRAQARDLQAIYGVAPPAGVAAPGAVGAPSVWLFADTAHELFNTEVPDGQVHAGDSFLRGATGMVNTRLPGAPADDFVFVENVLVKDRMEWLADKRTGAGRDPRLLQLPEAPVAAPHSFRTALAAASATPATLGQFRGPSGAKDLLPLIAASSQEPMAYCAAHVASLGLAPKSSMAYEFRVLFWFIYSFVCIDRCDPYQSVAMEHVCRRVRQMTKAARKNSKFPDYEGLHHFVEHMADPGQSDPVGALDTHVAGQLRDEGFVMKQQRLAREEIEAAEKAKKGKNKE